MKLLFYLKGCSFLCVPPVADHLLQPDLLHEHLLHLQEHSRHHFTGQTFTRIIIVINRFLVPNEYHKLNYNLTTMANGISFESV